VILTLLICSALTPTCTEESAVDVVKRHMTTNSMHACTMMAMQMSARLGQLADGMYVKATCAEALDL